MQNQFSRAVQSYLVVLRLEQSSPALENKHTAPSLGRQLPIAELGHIFDD
jgi:hypothetical protein